MTGKISDIRERCKTQNATTFSRSLPNVQDINRRILPRIKCNGRAYIVDFRLKELRDAKTAESIPFRELKESKTSDFKKNLRSLRSRYSSNDYIEGVDD